MLFQQLIHTDNNLDNIIADIPGSLGYYPNGEYNIISIDPTGHIVRNSIIDSQYTQPNQHRDILGDLKVLIDSIDNDNNVHIFIHILGDKDVHETEKSISFYEKLLNSDIPIGAIITVEATTEGQHYSCYKQHDSRYTNIPRADDVDIKLNGTVPLIDTTPSYMERMTKGFPIYDSRENMVAATPVLTPPHKEQSLSNELNNKIYAIDAHLAASNDNDIADLVDNTLLFIDDTMYYEDYDPHIDALGDSEIEVIATLMTILNPTRFITESDQNDTIMALYDIVILDGSHENMGIILDKAFTFDIDITTPTRLCAHIVRAICYTLEGNSALATACIEHVEKTMKTLECEDLIHSQPHMRVYDILSDCIMDDDGKKILLDDTINYTPEI